MSNNDPNNSQDQKISSTEHAATQSMKIASQLLKDILKYVYHIENVEIIWGAQDQNTNAPAFQYCFPKTDHNLISAEIFVQNFRDTKTPVTHSIDPQNNLIAFQGLVGISIFMKEFMVQNNIIPDPALLQSEPAPRKSNFISEHDLLALKKPFYMSVNDCVQEANIAGEYPFYETALFAFSYEHLEKSVNVAKMAGKDKKSNYTTDRLFHIH